MAKIYRSMDEVGGKPKTGSSAKSLGIRTEGLNVDILPDADGLVQPGTGGMSVAPSLSGLPAIRIPRRLAHLTPHALGGDAVRVWSMEINEFTDGPLNEKLYLRLSPKNPNHGVVEPIRAMPLDEYVEALEATLDEWHVDEN